MKTDLALIPVLFLATLAFGAQHRAGSVQVPTPDTAYKQLLSVSQFAFGGVGYAGATSEGELAYRAIAQTKNALSLFSSLLTNASPQGKLYALCGIRRFAPNTFDSAAKPLRTANPEVETIIGCLVDRKPASHFIRRIASGQYDSYLSPPNTHRSHTRPAVTAHPSR